MLHCPDRYSSIPEPQDGFTLLELIIVIILVVLLFLTAYNRLMPLRGEAEAAHVAATIGSLRSALGVAVAERILAGELEDVVALAGANPMTLLSGRPERYVGSTGNDSDPAPPGHWFFDSDSETLRYRVRFPQYLDGAPDGPIDLAWRIDVARDDAGPEGESRVRSVRLVDLDNPGWHFQEPAPARVASP